jgi:myo-inositol 2-dehydrogenase / D-chiro-inositol 1-dehydrogenase
MKHSMDRRGFIKVSSLAAGASALNMRLKAEDPSAVHKRKINLGLVGCGGRGSWIANLFQQHGGYEFHAVADYFQDRADKCGSELGVDRSRRFSTLSGYQRLMESGVEAVALEVPPYFFPQHAQAAVEARLHVYMAKPVAADVPGCLAIERAAKIARGKQRCFFVDYQMPTDPANIEVRKRILSGALGKISQVSTTGICSGFSDPPFAKTIENRLHDLIWVNDVAMGCDYIGNFDIHAIDAALWVLEKRPVAAVGVSRITRPDPHGDSHDVCSVIYEYADGLVHNHYGQGLANQHASVLSCTIHGQKGYGVLEYWRKAELRSDETAYSSAVDNLYEAGAARNIDTFHRNVTEGDFENDTVPRAVDSALTCILGREAAARGMAVTMAQIVAENKRLDVNLAGLKT